MARRDLIDCARGNRPADLLIRGGRIVNVLTGELHAADVAILGERIAGVGPGYEALETLDAGGALLLPGFLDGHVHIESSMCVPSQFARVVVPAGTTTVIVDAHEIANVRGLAGLAFMLADSEHIPLDVYMMAPSCVPASPYETSGAILGSQDLAKFLAEGRVLGMGEMMNFPGVVGADAEVMAKLALGTAIVDGHAPALTGKDLCAYVAAGVMSDHECRTADEAVEKLRLGMHVMIREGSLARNLVDLLPAINATNQERCMLVTDDRHADDLVAHGHINYAVKLAISHGLDPVVAVKLASLNCARYFRLDGVGAIAPGWQADILLVDGWDAFNVGLVVKRGRVVARDGVALFDPPRASTAGVLDTVRVAALAPGAFDVRSPGSAARVRVIGIVPGQCWSHSLERDLRIVDGVVMPDLAQDVAKIAVIERHQATGNVGLGFVHGFGIARGAIASTVAHDAHNLMVMGTNAMDMHVAAQALVESQGGVCAVRDGQVLELLALPIGGIMSDQPMANVAAKLHALQEVACEQLGIRAPHPFMTLAFLALSVIPELKITDRGYVDVSRFDLVPVLAPSPAYPSGQQ
ncbi:MAG: adenine deaminase [Candidatus Sericytochromatia bacterium]|nr:adenine deaminase [Candidatus Tanganyikabacteria bacterium]